MLMIDITIFTMINFDDILFCKRKLSQNKIHQLKYVWNSFSLHLKICIRVVIKYILWYIIRLNLKETVWWVHLSKKKIPIEFGKNFQKITNFSMRSFYNYFIRINNYSQSINIYIATCYGVPLSILYIRI